MQVLLVEDDHAIATGLAEALRGAGFTANHVASGEAAVYVMQSSPADIVVLDLGLPDMDGITVLERIRALDRTVPVMILTARDALEDRIRGLDSGADDYLVKPFEIAEFIARVRAQQRRLVTEKTRVIEIGGVVLDTRAQDLAIDGTKVELSRREYSLLCALMENAGRVVQRHALENRVYNWDEEIASNAIEVHIHHLRRKLPAEFIRTVRGVGYMIANP